MKLEQPNMSICDDHSDVLSLG
ncbi:MAG: hypothetical protein JWM38_1325, partial [Sphingomonas bacterium]|nr:hypothetical protein [Sphingomonas bacterium]